MSRYADFITFPQKLKSFGNEALNSAYTTSYLYDSVPMNNPDVESLASLNNNDTTSIHSFLNLEFAEWG